MSTTQKLYPFKLNLPVHTIKFNVENFIISHSKLIQRKNNFKELPIEISTETNNVPFATNYGDRIVFYITPIKYIISLFETRVAMKTWLVLLIIHEYAHSLDKFVNSKDNEYTRNTLINKYARFILKRDYVHFSIFAIKKEYYRWGKNTHPAIWDCLSFGAINDEKW